MDHRSDLMSAKSKFGNGPECQLRGVGGSSGKALGDENESGRPAALAAPSGHQRYHQRQQLQQERQYKRSRSGSSTSSAAAGAGCGSSQSRQVIASAEGMHAPAASKESTSWRTPATSRYVLPAFSLLIINKPAMCVFRWCSSASLHDTAAAARWGTMVAALQGISLPSRISIFAPPTI